MTQYLLDADAVIDFFHGIASTMAMTRDLYRQGDTLCTCDVVIAEAYSGLRPTDRDRGAELLASLLFLPTSPEAAAQAGRWRYDFRRLGLQLTTADCLIAAIAHEHRATLITGNTSHFPMPEVELRPLPRLAKSP